MILNELNEQQIEAVTTINGPLQIIAGAGSGKTRVLTCRIAYLIEQGVKPWNILALTFTNKAAKEMKERIAVLLDEESANGVWAGTFHSIFAKILRIEADEIGYDRYFTIYDTDDSLRVLKHIIKEHAVHNDVKPNSIFNGISKAKNLKITPAEYAEIATSKFERIVAEFYRPYQAYLKQNNAMDFDDLLLNTLLLFDKNREVLSKYQNKFHYVLIDEYQDTNVVQYDIMYRLAQARQNICVVGDDAQSIYKWRGADISNILNFAKHYPYCKTIKLEQNYRSTKNILAAADSVIRNNKQQLKKNLWTDNEVGEKIKLYNFDTDREEAQNIISSIAKRIGSVRLKDTAILYRTNAQSLAFENACRLYNMPYIVIGGMSFYKRKEVKDVLAYLQILVNPNDNISLYRIINEPPRGIGETSINKIGEYANQKGMSFLNALNHIDELNIKQTKTIKQIYKFRELVNKHTELVKQNAPFEHFIEYIKNTGIIGYYEEIGTQEAEDRLRNIEQVINDLTEFLSIHQNQTLQDYLEQTSLITDIDAKDLTEDRLTLMTTHSAKGLEYDCVYIVGMENDLFPLSSAKEEADVEEERRLFYVGITRAKKELTISYCDKRYKFGNISYPSPSFFLDEIDEELLLDIADNTFLNNYKKPSYSDFNRTQSPEQFQSYNQKQPFVNQKIYQPKKPFPVFDDMQYEDNYSQIPNKNPFASASYQAGDIVRHHQFGTGKVLAVSGLGDSLKLTVFFSSVGKKQLIAKYANLEKV